METYFSIAEALAADLAGASVDPNEAQKVLAYLRSKRDGRALFDYLQTVVNNGNAVIRSSRTLDYYHNLLTACQRHLRPLQHDYEELVKAYAWSLRLLRYYRTVPTAAEEKRAETQPQTAAPRQAPPAAKPQPTVPQLPEVGTIFTGKILDFDDETVMIAVPNFADDVAIALIKASIAERPRYRIGNTARVEVVNIRTLKSGRILLEVKPAKREG